jgi:hypothetical protein
MSVGRPTKFREIFISYFAELFFISQNFTTIREKNHFRWYFVFRESIKKILE